MEGGWGCIVQPYSEKPNLLQSSTQYSDLFEVLKSSIPGAQSFLETRMADAVAKMLHTMEGFGVRHLRLGPT